MERIRCNSQIAAPFSEQVLKLSACSIRRSLRVMEGLFERVLSRKVSEKGSTSCSTSGGDQESGASPLGQQGLAACSLVQQDDRRHLILGRMVLAEVIGTFILMFSVCGAVACSVLSRGELGLIEYASAGCAAVILIATATGPISGAHVNPSVTIAFATIGQFPWSKVPYYVSAQVLGSVSGAYIGKLVYDMPANYVVTRPMKGRTRAFWAELFATMFIMFIASALSLNTESIGQMAGFAIGAAVALAIIITGPVSGGSMNPARSLGPAIISGSFDDLWLYLVAPTAGAVLGAILYMLIHFPHRQGRSSISVANASLPTEASSPGHSPPEISARSQASAGYRVCSY